MTEKPPSKAALRLAEVVALSNPDWLIIKANGVPKIKLDILARAIDDAGVREVYSIKDRTPLNSHGARSFMQGVNFALAKLEGE